MVYLFVGLGGVLGSLLRYFVSAITHNVWNFAFPLGTLLINLSGAFLLGWVTSAYITPKKFHPDLLTGFSTGVIGSYTTFSTLCLETVELLDKGADGMALLYVGLSLAGGIAFAHAGMRAGDRGARNVREGL